MHLNERSAPTHRPPRRCNAIAFFGVIVPLVAVIVFATVQFGVDHLQQEGLHDAARAGARVAAGAHTTPAEVAARVRASLRGVVGPASIQAATITVTPSAPRPCEGTPPGTRVVVTVSVPSDSALPFDTTRGRLTAWGDYPCS